MRYLIFIGMVAVQLSMKQASATYQKINYHIVKLTAERVNYCMKVLINYYYMKVLIKLNIKPRNLNKY